MIPLIIAVSILFGIILLCRELNQIKEWLIWICIAIDVYMMDAVKAEKRKILKKAFKKRFPIMVYLIPFGALCRVVDEIENEIKGMKESVYLYKMLIYGVNFYTKDYLILLHLINEEIRKKA